MVNQENIRMYITNFGTVCGEADEFAPETTNSRMKLKHPLRLIPGQDGNLMVAALFMKEEWCLIPIEGVVEISVDDRVKRLYTDYESKIFSSIVMPSEKKIII